MTASEYNNILTRVSNGDPAAFQTLCHASLYANKRGAGECREIVKKEFQALMKYMFANRIPPQDTYVPQEMFDDIIAAKRRGEFVKASRLYAELAFVKVGSLSVNISVSWFKVLAGSGCIAEAFFLTEYVYDTVPQYARQLTMWWDMLKNNYLILKDILNRKDWDALEDRVTDLGGGFGDPVCREDIDAYILWNMK